MHVLGANRCNNSTKYLLHASMTTTSKKKKWNLLESCHKYALKLFLKCFFLARIGRPDILWSVISLHDRLRNGPMPATNAWIDWLPIFIVRVNTDNIVMWVILLNSADRNCFKILTFREIFSQESKQMIHEVGNIELCELLDTEPKTQCIVCLSYWDIGIVHCTCGALSAKRNRGE